MDDFSHDPIFDYTLLCKYRQKIGLDLSKDMIDLLLKKHRIKPSKLEKTEETHRPSEHHVSNRFETTQSSSKKD